MGWQKLKRIATVETGDFYEHTRYSTSLHALLSESSQYRSKHLIWHIESEGFAKNEFIF